jgi:putative tryptophan/tyrosine transport system substrate-binding protein
VRPLVAAAAVLCLAGTVAAQWPPGTRPFRIGFVSPISAGPTLAAFRHPLKDLGYVEGRSVVIEPRFAEGHRERLPGSSPSWSGSRSTCWWSATVGALAAKRATTTIPVVFTGLIDPTTGIVSSLARPGANLTGVTFGIGGAGFGGKWLEILRGAAPDVSHVGILWNSANPTAPEQVQELRDAAQRLGVKLAVPDAGSRQRLDAALWRRPSRAAPAA